MKMNISIRSSYVMSPRRRLASGVLSRTALCAVAISPGCGQEPAIRMSCLGAVIVALNPDSICDAKCDTIYLEPVVRRTNWLQFGYPSEAAIETTFDSVTRNVLSSFSRPVIWGAAPVKSLAVDISLTRLVHDTIPQSTPVLMATVRGPSSPLTGVWLRLAVSGKDCSVSAARVFAVE